MGIRFDDLRWLWIGAGVALVLVVIGWRWFGAMTVTRRSTAILTRVALMALLAALLGGVTLRRESDRMAVIAVVDVSGSVRRFASFGTDANGAAISIEDAARAWLSAASLDRKLDDVTGVVVFDGRAAVIMAPVRGAVDEPWAQVPMREGTDLGGALRAAGAMLPAGSRGRIVLFSDGQETVSQGRSGGGALEVATELGRRRGESDGAGASGFGGVDVVSIEYDVRREVVVESVDAPPRAAGESTVVLRVVMNATAQASGVLRVLDNGEPLGLEGGVGERRVTLAAGRTVELLEVRLDDSRLHRFEVVFEPDGGDGEVDTVRENNRGRAFTLASGRSSVLVIDGVSGGSGAGLGAALPTALSGAGFSVETIAPEAFTRDLLWLQGFDAIILQNVPAEAIDAEAQAVLSTYVREMAGGLIMVGGPDSLGPGGWKGTPLEPLLPVKLDLPEQLVTPAAAVVIVMDMSGSMSRSVMGSGLSQMEIAAEGAARAIQTMDRMDMIGVVAFSDRTEVVVPLDRNRDPTRAIERIRGISPDGGTTIGPAVELAQAQLIGATAQEKHIIVLTDGKSTDAEALPAIGERVRADGIRISTISVGDEADTASLIALARTGGGKFYRVVDPMLLPRIFIKAIRVIRSPMIRLEPFVPVLAGSQAEGGQIAVPSPIVEELLDASRGMRSGVPPLQGLVLTRARVDPTVTLAMLSPRGDPLLAYWNVGLGKAAVWASDAHDWSREWLNWPGYGRMWSQVVRMVARPAAGRGFELRTELDGDRLVVRLEAMPSGESDPDRRRLASSNLTVPIGVYAPDGSRLDTRLEPIGAGLYEAHVDAQLSGTYVVVARPRSGAEALPPLVAGVSRTEGLEYRSTRSNRRLLEEIAARSGGRVHAWDGAPRARLFDREGVPPAEARVPIWRTLLWVVLAVMLLDIATRRIAWDRWISREFGAEVRRGVVESVRDRGSAAAATVGRLRGREVHSASEAAPYVGSGGAQGSNRDGPAPQGTTLGEDDAAEIVRRERQRRRDAAMGGSPRASASASSEPATGESAASSKSDVGMNSIETGKSEGTAEPTKPDERGGLFAAKKRAKHRIDDRE